MSTGNARARLRLGGFEAGLSASVDERAAGAGQDLLLAEVPSICGFRLEAHFARRSFSALCRPPFRDPLLEAAVQHSDVARTEVSKREPAARSRVDRRIVVDDDAVVAADAELFHRRSELLGAGKHVWRRVGVVGELIDVEEPGARNVALQIFVAAASARGGH